MIRSDIGQASGAGLKDVRPLDHAGAGWLVRLGIVAEFGRHSVGPTYCCRRDAGAAAPASIQTEVAAHKAKSRRRSEHWGLSMRQHYRFSAGGDLMPQAHRNGDEVGPLDSAPSCENLTA